MLEAEVEAIRRTIPKKIEGFLNIAKLRASNERALVKAFNKGKHQFLAFPIDRSGGHQRLLPTAKQVKTGESQGQSYKMDGALIDTTPEYISGRARQARESQAVLCDTLLLILNGLYGHEFPAPEWIHRVHDEMIG